MTFLCFTQDQLLTFLKENGYTVCSNEFWDEYDRVMIQKGDVSFPLQMQKEYYFPFVIRLCRNLEIEAPENFKIAYDGFMANKGTTQSIPKKKSERS